MCLASNDKLKIATKSMIVYKWVSIRCIDDTYISPYYNGYYKIGKTTWVSVLEMIIDRSKFREKLLYEYGLHCYTNMPDKLNNDFIVLKCKIPVGAFYAVSSDGSEIVTNRLKPIEEIKED